MGTLPKAHFPRRIKDPTYKARLVEIGEKYNKSWAQVILRYNCQSGIYSIPGSFSPAGQLENLRISTLL